MKILTIASWTATCGFASSFFSGYAGHWVKGVDYVSNDFLINLTMISALTFLVVFQLVVIFCFVYNLMASFLKLFNKSPKKPEIIKEPVESDNEESTDKA